MSKWYEQPETKARFRRMPAPFQNIWIGSDPTDGFTLKDAQHFDAIINVSDSVCAYLEPSRPDQRMHWTPINELAYWTYTPFYFIKHVLDYHYDRGDKVYLHCHAGAWRSPSMFRFWLLSRGLSKEEALEIEYQKDKIEEWMKRYCWQREGEFPVRIEEFYKRYRETERHSLYALIAGPRKVDPLVMTTELYAERLLKRIKRHNRWSWYYSCKYWMNERKRRFGMWKQGTRAIRTGPCSTDWVELNGWMKTPLGIIPCLFKTPKKEVKC